MRECEGVAIKVLPTIMYVYIMCIYMCIPKPVECGLIEKIRTIKSSIKYILHVYYIVYMYIPWALRYHTHDKVMLTPLGSIKGSEAF